MDYDDRYYDADEIADERAETARLRKLTRRCWDDPPSVDWDDEDDDDNDETEDDE